MFKTQNFLRRILYAELDIPKPQYTDLPMGKIEYAIYGTGKPLLIIHGGLGGYDQSVLMFRQLLADGYQLICPSRPGYLGTALDTGKSIDAQADLLMALLDYLEIEQVTAIGFSAGGLILYSLAIRYPHRIKALVALDAISGEYWGNEQRERLRHNYLFGDVGLWMAKETMIYYPQMVIKKLMNSEGYLEPQMVEAGINQIMSDPGQLGFIARMINAITNYKPREAGMFNDLELGENCHDFELDKISCPALIIHGTHDAEVKFYHGVFAYQGLASRYKEYCWLKYGTHMGIYFSPYASTAQNKLKTFLAKYS